MFRQLSWLRLAAVSAVLVTVAVGGAVAPVGATTIAYSYDEDARPAFDPDGTKLKAIVSAASVIWADYLNAYSVNPNGSLSPAVYHFDLWYENTDEGELGYYNTSWDNMAIDTTHDDGTPIEWYFDPTPFDNSEYSMQSIRMKDYDQQLVDDAFDGQGIANLEIAYSGGATDPAAMGKYDLLSAVLHEMGHMLGFNWNPNDDDYDFAGSAIGGRSLAVNEIVDLHGGIVESLMSPKMGPGVRKLPSTTDILALADEGQPMNFDVPRMEFLGERSADWQDMLNWIGGAVPDGDNQVFIRHGGSAIMAANGTAASLLIGDYSQVVVMNNQYRVLGATKMGNSYGVTGSLSIGSTTSGIARFETKQLELVAGQLSLQNPFATLVVNNDMNVRTLGKVLGQGRIEVGGLLVNNGEIGGGTFQTNGSVGQLTMASTGTGKIDLDGNDPLREHGRVTAVGGNVVIAGPLTDEFNGTATIGAGRAMWFYQPWTNNGTLEFRGGNSDATAAWLGDGGLMTFGREAVGMEPVGVMDVDGLGKIGSPVTLNASAKIQVRDANDQLTFSGPTLIRGGTFEGAGSLAIANVTKVFLPNPFAQNSPPSSSSQAFTLTPGPLAQTQVVDLSPETLTAPEGVRTSYPTSYAFTTPVRLNFRGVLLAYGSSVQLPRQTTMAGGRIGGLHTVNQIGDLVVETSGVINPTTFLWGVDATNHKTTLRSGSRLDLTPQQIVRSGSDNVYRGAIKLESNSQLYVNLGAASSWRLAGSLQLDVGSTVSGDDMINSGVVSGNGSFQITRFENAGRVVPGRMPGGLRMPTTTYVQTTAGILDVVLGQNLKGQETGLLTVGTAQLAGTLALSLGSGVTPTVGSEYDVLRAGSITGTFSNVSLTGALGTSYRGSVLYFGNRVAFRITSATGKGFGVFSVSAVPEPASLGLAVMAMGALMVKRRKG